MDVHQLYCRNEYDVLKKVIVVSPRFMEIKEIINTTQRYYSEENIDRDVAIKEHEHFVHKLEACGIDVIHLDAKEKLNEQVFTRDIGFVIENQLFVSSLRKEIRQRERAVLKNWLDKHSFPYHVIEISSIEGGDVIVDRDNVWVGLSTRTTLGAIQYLKEKLINHTVIPINLRKDILHLDCALNIISEDTALIFRPGIDGESYQLLQEKYTLIEVNEDEQFNLGTNVFAIGNKRIISLPQQKRINQVLEQKGFTVIEVPFSEIIKSGGSFRCCTLPILREPSN